MIDTSESRYARDSFMASWRRQQKRCRGEQSEPRDQPEPIDRVTRSVLEEASSRAMRAVRGSK